MSALPRAFRRGGLRAPTWIYAEIRRTLAREAIKTPSFCRGVFGDLVYSKNSCEVLFHGRREFSGLPRLVNLIKHVPECESRNPASRYVGVFVAAYSFHIFRNFHRPRRI